ncbi:uncharacterized protein LOC122571738 [Bombus pyrosoma]|uniref:uncharacterized protein LOC122571738 n=1 Tax=Bombus pyrosoma TaxID=396416 RepID=UPI001CB9A0F5|nr:uncharacterized protein LOC122571738 [Bombus pyrosoma]
MKDIVPETFSRTFNDKRSNLLGAPMDVTTNQEDFLQRIIEEACEESRRRITQTARRKNEECAEQKRADYKDSKKELRPAIFSSKRLAWKKFTAILDRDPWGLPCKRVIARLRSNKSCASLGKEQAANIIGNLFLTVDIGASRYGVTEEIGGGTPGAGNTIHMENLKEAVGRLNVKKAVGIDRIPGIVIKFIYEHGAQDLLAMVNAIYEIGRIPAKWKVARLILLNKPGRDPRLSSSYRPISILPAMSKVWEYTFKAVIKKELGMDPFHRNQFGFRKGKGTIDAITQVLVDPLLWNLVYDSLLAKFDNQPNVRVIAFADDLAVMVGLKKKESVEGTLNLHMQTTIRWNKNSGLQKTRDKTEIILLTGMRVPRSFGITLAGMTLCTHEAVKYLGVVLDSRRNFYKHIEEVCARADALVGAIKVLLPNVNSPSNACRKLYYQVWESVVLYASPVWGDALNKSKIVDEFRRAQRSSSTAYRTVSHAALCVLSGTIPIHIMARWPIFVARKSVRPNLEDPEGYSNQLRMFEEEAVEAWKTEWSRLKTDVNIPDEIVPDVDNNSVRKVRHRLNTFGSKERVARKMFKTMNRNIRIYGIAE